MVAFFARICSGSSLKGMVRGEADEEDPGGSRSSGSTPNDTAHGGSKFGSSSWRKLASKSTRSLSSPKKPPTPPPSIASFEGPTPVRPSMEPVMERTRSALTDLEAVKFLVEDLSHKHWRPATPQDQERFDRLEESDIKPLVALGEGAYGSVNLCRVVASPTNSPMPAAARSAHSAAVGPSSAAGAASPFSGLGGGGARAMRRRSASAATVLRAGAPSEEAPKRRGARSAASVPAAPAGHRRVASDVSGALAEHAAAAAEGAAGSSGRVDACEEQGAGAKEPVAVTAAAAAPSRGNSAVAEVEAEAEAGTDGCPKEDPGSGSAMYSEEDAGAADAAAEEEAAAAEGGDGGERSDDEEDEEDGDDHGDGGKSGAAEVEQEGPGIAPVSSLTEPQLIVAVKRVPLGWNQERELMQLHRCQQCPFIVRLFGFVDDGSEHCSYVMEWAEGGDLGAMLASLKDRRGANKQRLLMSEASARYYLACLLLALEFMHAHGLLHRDIKPSNLLLTSDGTAKLADLGFTVALDAAGTTVGCCGTTGYIAPEVYAYGGERTGRKPYGVPADIWSAGATLYQILTGSVVTDVHEEVLRKGWRPPSHPQFSKALQDLLNRMLAAKPTSRAQSAASIMRHAWFAGFDWRALREGRMKAPYVPAERRKARDTPAHDEAAAASAAAAAALLPLRRGSSGGAGGGGPPPASPGGERLAPVLERAPSLAAEGGGEAAVVQRSALSGRGEGSVRRGREGLARDGASFETVLPTLPRAEAKAAAAALGACDGAAPAAVAVLPAAQESHGGLVHGGGHTGTHAHHQGMTVRFAVGVAECA